MPTFSRVKTWVSNEVLTASDLNAEFDNLLNNMTPDGIEDASANVAAMQATANPGGVGTESLATTIRGELQRIRYTIKEIKGTAQWYGAPPFDMSTGVDTTDIVDGAVTTIKIEDDAVTTDKILDGNVTAAKLDSSAVATFQSQTITADGNFSVPANVNEVLVIGCGGGGGGGGGGNRSGGGQPGGGGGGGAGAPVIFARYAVTPLGTVAAVIGAGGTGGVEESGAASTDGAASTFGTLTFPGGGAGFHGANTGAAGDGGHAVGTAAARSVHIYAQGGDGQSTSTDAENGYTSQYATGGLRGTLATDMTVGQQGGAGGGGGSAFGAGGVGADRKTASGSGGNNGTSAAANTGGGGGGASGATGANPGNGGTGGNGGSGKIIVLWVATP